MGFLVHQVLQKKGWGLLQLRRPVSEGTLGRRGASAGGCSGIPRVRSTGRLISIPGGGPRDRLRRRKLPRLKIAPEKPVGSPIFCVIRRRARGELLIATPQLRIYARKTIRECDAALRRFHPSHDGFARRAVGPQRATARSTGRRSRACCLLNTHPHDSEM
jgi:hypothetical protein